MKLSMKLFLSASMCASFWCASLVSVQTAHATTSVEKNEIVDAVEADLRSASWRCIPPAGSASIPYKGADLVELAGLNDVGSADVVRGAVEDQPLLRITVNSVSGNRRARLAISTDESRRRTRDVLIEIEINRPQQPGTLDYPSGGMAFVRENSLICERR